MCVQYKFSSIITNLHVISCTCDKRCVVLNLSGVELVFASILNSTALTTTVTL